MDLHALLAAVRSRFPSATPSIWLNGNGSMALILCRNGPTSDPRPFRMEFTNADPRTPIEIADEVFSLLTRPGTRITRGRGVVIAMVPKP